jgi:tRNA-dihydrouridine synthase A
MREPALVADCVAAMSKAVSIPVTIKCRLGVDDQDPEQSLFALVEACAAAGTRVFVVHARKAWLEGLSPKENRDVPPLDYALVHRLKRERPELTVVLNGGLSTLADAAAHLEVVDGVMLGRAAYHDPALLGCVDSRLLGAATADVTPFEAAERHRPYLAAELARGTRLAAMTRHMLGLFQGRPGARAWRRELTVGGIAPGAGLEVLDRALALVTEAEARRPARAA